MLLASVLIGAYYPLTQIYQHEEDSNRGDRTISYLLGIKGTFIFTLILFLFAVMIAAYYFSSYYSWFQFQLFLAALLIPCAYFIYWFVQVLQDSTKADFTNAMRMTFLSSAMLIVFYGVLFFLNH